MNVRSFSSVIVAMWTLQGLSAKGTLMGGEIAVYSKSRSNFMVLLFMVVLVFSVPFHTRANPGDGSDFVYISVEEITDKIRGGLLGQILGNLNGLPHEMQYIDEPGDVKNYVPALPDGAWTDDDTDFEWVYVVEMQLNRMVMLNYESIYDLWRERVNTRIWCSNRYARYLMDIGIKPPFTGYSELNPWAGFNISGQFLCETFGLMAPAMPQTAARIGLNYTTVAIDNEPAQTTQLFTSMIATAFVERDIGAIIEAGKAAIDPRSELNGIVGDIQRWNRDYPDNWKETRRLLKEKYTQEEGKMRDRNGYELNTGSIIAALLYGKGDFAESLKLAFNFGWDADCNAATVGTILGVITGYRNMLSHNDPFNPEWQIVDRYRNVTRDNMPENETITSFADRIVELFEMINLEKGGDKIVLDNRVMYKIRVESPRPVQELIPNEVKLQILEQALKPEMEKDLLSGKREEMARTAYLAICLGNHEEYANDYPDAWREACYALSGYWKIIDNIFTRNVYFKELEQWRERFERAGFRAPARSYSNQDIWDDKGPWKDPETIYRK